MKFKLLLCFTLVLSGAWPGRTADVASGWQANVSYSKRSPAILRKIKIQRISVISNLLAKLAPLPKDRTEFDSQWLVEIKPDTMHPGPWNTRFYIFNSGDTNQCVRVELLDHANGVTNIGDFAFLRCHRLTGVLIPGSVISIGVDAFNGCQNLSSVTIPDSVTSIGKTAFAVCPRLTGITVDKANSSYSSMAGVLFNKNQTVLIQYPPGRKAGSYTISDSVTTVGINAFAGCSSLTHVIIPNSVISIGDGAFALCTNLTNVTIPSSVTNIGNFAFMGCSNVTIPKTVTHVGNQTLPGGP